MVPEFKKWVKLPFACATQQACVWFEQHTHMQNENIHKRERYSAEFKETVALEALSGAKTHVQIALNVALVRI